jgi:hypothetical protein
LFEVAAKDLYPDLGADAGRQHFDAVDYGLSPDIVTPGILSFWSISLIKPSRRYTGPPLARRFQVNDGFVLYSHGAGSVDVSARPAFTDHPLDLWKTL